MNIFNEFESRICAAVAKLQDSGELPLGLDLSKISTEPPRDENHGDVATNVAMILAKPARKNPREIAEKIAEILAQANDVIETSIAGPGFINLKICQIHFGLCHNLPEFQCQ